MSHERLRRLGGVVTGMALLTAGACSTSEDPGRSPTSTPATANSTTPSEPFTTGVPFDPVPEAARQHTNEGAIAFAFYFIDQMNKGYQHPQANILSRLCLPTSNLCTKLQADIDSLSSDKRRSNARVGEIRGQEIIPVDVPDSLSVGLHYYVASYSIIDEEGKTTRTQEATYFPFELVLKWRGDGWLVQNIRTTVS